VSPPVALERSQTPIQSVREASTGLVPAPKKAAKEVHPGRKLVIDAFCEEFTAAFGTSYPLIFSGHPSDGPRVKVWLDMARVSTTDPGPGVERLRLAARAYMAAVEARTAFPIGDPATTEFFTKQLAKWLQTDSTRNGRTTSDAYDYQRIIAMAEGHQ
jgi:hypothetical protein